MTEFIAQSRQDWRDWLASNGQTEKEVWLVLQKAASDAPGVRYHEAVDEALCFGWIDSQARRRDDTTTYQRFSPRGPRSNWSKPNRERVEVLIEEGLMTAQGQAAIDDAKRTGRWG